MRTNIRLPQLKIESTLPDIAHKKHPWTVKSRGEAFASDKFHKVKLIFRFVSVGFYDYTATRNQILLIQTNNTMCAIFGVFNHSKAAEFTAVGLHGNQHRAIDYAGIVSCDDGGNFYRERGSGLARQVFNEPTLNRLHGRSALGHIRYPTVTDNPTRDNIQPILGNYGGSIALAHNGNVTNVTALRRFLPDLKMSTSMDSEFFLHLLEARHTGDVVVDLKSVFGLIQGSFSLGILLPDRLIAVRDKSGNRPLSIGRLEGGFCISSETCAFPNVGAKFLAEVEPGSIVSIGLDGLSVQYFAEVNERRCRFEAPYYSHPGSNVFGENIARFRTRLGELLEKCCPVEGGADVVTPVPDSANFIATGFGK